MRYGPYDRSNPLIPIVHERALKLADQVGQPIAYEDLIAACSDLDAENVRSAIALMVQTDQMDDDDTVFPDYEGEHVLYVNRF